MTSVTPIAFSTLLLNFLQSMRAVILQFSSNLSLTANTESNYGSLISTLALFFCTGHAFHGCSLTNGGPYFLWASCDDIFNFFGILSFFCKTSSTNLKICLLVTNWWSIYSNESVFGALWKVPSGSYIIGDSSSLTGLGLSVNPRAPTALSSFLSYVRVFFSQLTHVLWPSKSYQSPNLWTIFYNWFPSASLSCKLSL